MTDQDDSRESTCPVCAGTETVSVGAKGGHEYLRCLNCQLIYAPVLPTPEMFAEAYGKYRTRKRLVLRKSLKLAPMIWRHLLRTRGLRERRGGGRRPMTFLDIGSNTGYNTEAARRLGCEAHGLETSDKAVAFARDEYPRCTFHLGEIVPFAQDGHAFDLIYCSEVIEHVPEPHAFVEAIAKLSHEGTLLFLTTPDTGHWKVPEDLMSWKEVIPVEHLRLYDQENLKQLLAMHGFKVDFSMWMPRANQRHYCSLVSSDA
jgi:2-polyprenyl-3-methyl-5-hydroxy-6-metoxy-1,4-benzoquinol methylase